MRPKWHILFGFSVSYILVYFFDFSILAGLTIFLSSVLIDIDHYILYVFLKKDLNPKRAIQWFFEKSPIWDNLPRVEKRNFQRGVFIFHGIPFWLIVFFLSYIHIFFLWILIGIAVHMAADFPKLLYDGEPLYMKTFPCYTIIKNKNKRSLSEL